MMDILQALLKSFTGEKNQLSALWAFIKTAIGYTSAIYAFALLMKNLQITDVLEQWVKVHGWFVFLVGIVISLFHNREKLRYFKKLHNSDLQIELAVRDVFCCTLKATSYVIPTNTFFQTRMDGEYISKESVQGRFQNMYFRDKLPDLDKLIRKNLDEQGVPYSEAHDKFGEVRVYPLGTVAKVDLKKKHYYFVAISDVNEQGKPINQSLDNVDIALNGVVEAIERIGHCDNLSTPIIGAGRAAITDATIERVFMRIVNKFVETDKKIVNRLIICIRPKDYVDGKVDIEKLKKYLDYKCEF